MNTQLLHKQVRECIAELESIGLQLPYGIQYKVSPRMTRKFGQCAQRYNRLGAVEQTIITISMDLPESVGKETIMHEMVHALVGNRAGHGYEFHAMARRINRALGYDIRTKASPEESKAVREVRACKPQAQKVKLICGCGQEYLVSPRSKYYINPSIGRCGNCHQSGLIKRA